jgi:hypothetical protein
MPLGRPAQAIPEVPALNLRRRRETAARGVDGRHPLPELALHLRVGQRHRERPRHVLEQPRHPEQRPIVEHDGELFPVAPDRRRDAARPGLTEGDRTPLLVDVAAPVVERVGHDERRITQCAPEPRAQGLALRRPQLDHQADDRRGRPVPVAQVGGQTRGRRDQHELVRAQDRHVEASGLQSPRRAHGEHRRDRRPRNRRSGPPPAGGAFSPRPALQRADRKHDARREGHQR